jgi:predicted GH43/DUF377 family glycosyl hydrolase
MKWKKLGLVYAPDKKLWWSQMYAMMPTPVHLQDRNVIRIFFGTTDADRFGRTAFLDVDANDPTRIVSAPDKYVLDLGIPGTFDDCGAVPSSILVKKGVTHLYYVGFQRVQKVPYMLFSGLAVSEDNQHFRRYSEAPILDRSNQNFLSNAAPFVIYDSVDGTYKMWFWLGTKWVEIRNKLYLSAQIKYATSLDAVSWKIQDVVSIDPDPAKEFSVGRPWVIKDKSLFKMFYSVRYIDKLYRLGYAESPDGIHWERKDSEIGIDVSESGWDSEMVCYPAVITVNNKTYMFYNGNNNGETGFGVAELVDN